MSGAVAFTAATMRPGSVSNGAVGTSTSLTLKAVDLTAYAGQLVRIAFSFGPNFEDPGWYIDDLSFVLL